MKTFKFYSILFTALLLAVLPAYLMAADNFNQSVSGVAAAGRSTYGFCLESFDEVYLGYYPSAVTDSAGSWHTKPLYIGNMNDNSAYVYTITNAASDYNIIFHYSNDKNKWVSITATGLDLVTNTGRYDTLGVGDQTQFKRFQYLIIELDGQTAANPADVCYLYINFQKDALFVDSGGQFIKSQVFWFDNTSTTNP